VTDIFDELMARRPGVAPTTHTLCCVLGAHGDTQILFAGDSRMYDWVRECGPDGPNAGLDDPPGKGVWIWEGTFTGGEYSPFSGDYGDVNLTGTFRRMNDHELERFLAGNSPFEQVFP
jgi:hypothetical protein